MSSGYVALTLSFEREGDQWVGECLETSTSTFADSLEDCQAELRELVVDHLEVLEEVGERERCFKEWGITVHPMSKTQDGIFRAVRSRQSSVISRRGWGEKGCLG